MNFLLKLLSIAVLGIIIKEYTEEKEPQRGYGPINR